MQPRRHGLNFETRRGESSGESPIDAGRPEGNPTAGLERLAQLLETAIIV